MKPQSPISSKSRFCAVPSLLGSAVWFMALMAISCLPLGAASYSNWLKNISASGDPEALYVHSGLKMAVSGNDVHLAWQGVRKDFSDGALFYTRSADGGLTFETPKILASGLGQSSEAFSPESNSLAAEGAFVHLVYSVGWPRKLQYLRSTDQGNTFAPPQTIVSGFFENYTPHLSASGDKLAIAWSLNGNDAPRPRALRCSYSNDNGATFATTQMAYATENPYRYAVVDAVRSGDYVYILTITTEYNWGGSAATLFLWSSSDGGATFKVPVPVTVAASDMADYARQLQNQQYTPNLVASGATVNITWVNIDIQSPADFLWTAPTLRTRRSTDGGVSLGDPITLHTFPGGYGTGANAGQETICGSGNNLYITTILGDAPAGTYLWRSTDAGATWGAAQRISTGGWWPVTRVDPSDSNRIHLVNSAYFLSKNAGVSFDGGINPHTTVANWDSPQMAVDASGTVHYAAPSGGPYSNEIFYRRIVNPPAPGTNDKALTLVRETSGTRSDNMQVAAGPDLNFTTAMTVEFWVRRDSDDTNTDYLQHLVWKKRLTGWGSYEVGAWGGSQIYARLVTDQAPNSVWIGSGVGMSKGVWYHVALTYDAGLAADNLKLYVNGVLRANSSVQGAILSDSMDSPLMLGKTDSDRGGFSIDELRLWNKTLPGPDIAANMDKARTGTENGLVAYYNFNDTTRDITGRGNHGVLMFRESYTAYGALAALTAPYASWQKNLFTPINIESGSAVMFMDFDGDGANNLVEYAFNGDPKTPDAAAIVPDVAGDRLRISFPCDASRTDLTYSVQASATLLGDSWTEIARSVGGAAVVPIASLSTVSDSGTGSRTVTVADAAPLAPGGKRYLRIKVTSP